MRGRRPKVNAGESIGGCTFFLIRCSVVNSETLWSQNKMFKIRTLTRSKIKILTFSKTKYISDSEEWGRQPTGLSNSDATNCLIHLSIWSGHGF